MDLAPTQVILKPLITEKSTWEGEARNRYRFEVHPKANKQMVRDAIQKIYSVRVTNVATQNKQGKVKRTRFGLATGKNMKTAIVQLHEDDRIDLF